MKYNTQKEHLTFKEYGRNVQKLAEYILNLEDKEEQLKLSNTLVQLMKQLNPLTKEHGDNQRIWDHLHVMSNFNLEIESPYPIPDKETLNRKPDRLSYPQSRIKHRHYGKNVELLMQKVVELETQEDQENGAIFMGKLMKILYTNWNKENVDDHIILENIREFTDGKVDLQQLYDENKDILDDRQDKPKKKWHKKKK